jgi:hypothetical protein
MKLKERIDILSKLKPIFENLTSENDWIGFELGITKDEYETLQNSIAQAKAHNQWFTKESIYEALTGLSKWLTVDQLESWTAAYPFAYQPKKVAIIMAGNIPLVGFHDLISVFLSGHMAIVKLSSNDKILLPAILNVLSAFNPDIKNWIDFTEEKLPEFDAVIATGSDNSALYFETYFGKYPNIIRKNRTSVAVLSGKETKEDLKLLGKDIFTYFGLGCRNVSKILIPDNYNLNHFFEAIYDFGEVIYHNKYANNYDYNKAVYLMNLVPILDNNFIILKEDEQLHSPLGVLFYQRFKNQEDIESYLLEHKDNIQVVIGENYTPFGQAQCPSLNDYADGIDTMKFLGEL